MRKTIICDIDATLIRQHSSLRQVMHDAQNTSKDLVLEGAHENLREWDKKGYCIILLTARKECLRDLTVKQLERLGIFYDQLIMGAGNGERILINNRAKDSQFNKARSVNVDFNEGFKELIL